MWYKLNTSFNKVWSATQTMDVIKFRKAPPKIRPLLIILTALSLGLLFLGVTLTIIGNWPGYSPYGGNPLKIVGPILLGVGILVLIGVTVDACVRASKPKDYYQQSFSQTTSTKRYSFCFLLFFLFLLSFFPTSDTLVFEILGKQKKKRKKKKKKKEKLIISK